jgi:hypothetical protein
VKGSLQSAALLATLVALMLPAATVGSAPAPSVARAKAGPGTPVLGFDWSVAGARLAWYDPATLTILAGRKAPLANHACSWAFSAGRDVLALAACKDAELRFVNARTMRVLGDLRLGLYGGPAGSLTWFRPDRVLALVRTQPSVIAVVDPLARKTVRRVSLPGRVWSTTARFRDGLAMLVGPEQGFASARLALADAEGGIRTVTLDRISIGSEVDESGQNPMVRSRTPGFAVDPAGRAYVIAPDGLVAEVDLASLALTYHEQPRSLAERLLGWLQPAAAAKTLDGPERTARWLGDGLIAVSGADYATTRDAQGKVTLNVTPYGLRLLDTGDWRWRTIDRDAIWFTLGPDVLLVTHGPEDGPRVASAYGRDGALRYRVQLPTDNYLTLSAGFGYVCEQARLREVVDARAGVQAMALDAKHDRPCAPLLAGSSSEF